MAGYDFQAVEAKWQQYWAEHETFRQPNPGEEGFRDQPKMYVLDMFPYPSGAGLHVGHPEGYTATDIVCRYARMKGRNVLHPMGYDAFGLPAQQYAVDHGIHPRETTARNIANIERQIRMFGFSYDWSRRLATTDVEYYRWTQWIFLQMFHSWYDPVADAARPIDDLLHKLESGEYVVDLTGRATLNVSDGITPVLGEPVGTSKWHELSAAERRAVIDSHRLAYMEEVPVNWCPKLGTVLANEEVTNEGRSDRGDHPVFRRALRQWMLRITCYAERLERDLDLLDWPEPIKIMQRNWIGRSTGAEVDFPLVGGSTLRVESLFRRIAAQPTEERPSLRAESFVPRDPSPKGQPCPPGMAERGRDLPHIRIAGATYFVTFRTKDSELSPDERTIALRAMRHWDGDRCSVYGAVVLEDHAHMILQPFQEEELSEILESIKKFSAREINKARGGSGHLWQVENFDHVIRHAGDLTRFVYYICENPVKRGLVDRFDRYHWLFVNAEELVSEDGEPFGNSRDHNSESCGPWFRQRAEEGYPAVEEDEVIRVYTTRPDTLFGATYMVLAPEHPLVEQITTDEQRQAVRDYVRQAERKSELERMAETKAKTGVFTGACAVNPVNRRQIPVWVADYVLMGYGTGAIMAVPAHDTRDLEFAEAFGLEVIQVVQPPDGVDWRGYVDDGVAVNSGEYNGLTTAEFKQRISEDLGSAGLGEAAVNYRIRDWIFSRQWYWGEPFPIVHCDECGPVALPEDQLPLELPEMDDFQPVTSDDPTAPPQPPLGRLEEWVRTACPSCGKPARRETNAMPQWAGSCWYYLRYLDPSNDERFCDPKIERYWMGPSAAAPAGGVDLYVGGAEHAVLHLLYARFWHKVLHDLGHVSSPEPFRKLFNQGMIRSYAYRDSRGVCIGYDDVDRRDDGAVHRQTGEKLVETVEKMSKSLKNVVNPDDVVAEYGADTFRLYEMFMGPLEASKPWNTQDVQGSGRFLNRVWRMVAGDDEGQAPLLGGAHADTEIERALHKLIRKVGEDIEAMKFNTAIAAMMEFVNLVYREGRIARDQAERLVLLLAPFAPHIAEELWQRLGHEQSLAYEPWPEYDEKLVADETLTLPVQINGKVRGSIEVPAEAGEDEVFETALRSERIASLVEGKAIVKRIYVPKKIVNLVVK